MKRIRVRHDIIRRPRHAFPEPVTRFRRSKKGHAASLFPNKQHHNFGDRERVCRHGYLEQALLSQKPPVNIFLHTISEVMDTENPY